MCIRDSYSVEAKQAVEATLAEADAAIQAGLSSNDVEAWKTKISKAVKDFEKNGVIYIPVSYTHLDVYKRQVKNTIKLFLKQTIS